MEEVKEYIVDITISINVEAISEAEAIGLAEDMINSLNMTVIKSEANLA